MWGNKSDKLDMVPCILNMTSANTVVLKKSLRELLHNCNGLFDTYDLQFRELLTWNMRTE